MHKLLTVYEWYINSLIVVVACKQIARTNFLKIKTQKQKTTQKIEKSRLTCNVDFHCCAASGKMHQ